MFLHNEKRRYYFLENLGLVCEWYYEVGIFREWEIETGKIIAKFEDCTENNINGLLGVLMGVNERRKNNPVQTQYTFKEGKRVLKELNI